MQFTLTKAEKKAAREIIGAGLQHAYEQAILDAESVIAKWRENQVPVRDTYMTLFKTMHNHDMHISSLYNDITGSRYVYVIAAQVADGVTKPEDLEPFREPVRNFILRMAEL